MDERILQTIFQHRNIGYLITDTQFRVERASEARAFIDSGQIGQSLLDVAPELIGNEIALSDILSGTLPRLELSWINRDMSAGQTVYLNLLALPYRNSHGQIVGLILALEDVTPQGLIQQTLTQHRNELRLLRDQLARQNLELTAANAELRQLDELKSRFVSIAAHELRGPLASMSGYVELMLDDDSDALTPAQQDYLGVVQRGIGRLLTILNNLLDLTRIEADRLELLLRPNNLETLVNDVLAEMRPQLEAKALSVSVRAEEGLPLVLCDDTRMVQIVSNLLSNAIKYTHPGGQIRVQLSRAIEAGYVQMAVTDTGVGISEVDQTKLFSRFFRAETASQTGATGAGLGLYITRLLVELHGGTIWLTSQLGLGSTFYVTFLQS